MRQLTNNAGEVTYAESYDPYGVVTQSSGEGQSAYGYTGEQQSNDIVYLRSRYYNAANGRFLTKDPSRAERNLYSYTRGNPVNRIDPSGLYSQEMIYKNINPQDFFSKPGDEKKHPHWGFYALLRNAEDFDSIKVGHVDLMRLHPNVFWDFMSAEIWSVNCETIIIGGQLLSEYYRTHILDQRDPLIWWRDTTPMYYNLETMGRMNASERGNFKFTDGTDNNETSYPLFHGISIGVCKYEANIMVDLDGNKYLSINLPKVSGGRMYGIGYTEGYLCNWLSTCPVPSSSEIEQAIAGFCAGGELVIGGGVNVSPICHGFNLQGFSSMMTYYAGLEGGVGGGLL